MDRELLKRALRQTFASPEDEETDQVLDTLAANLLKNLHKEKSHVNIVVAEAFKSGAMNELESLLTTLMREDFDSKYEVISLVKTRIEELK